MYRYTEFDRQMLHERVAQFRDQVERWKDGALSDDELRPLRLQNGVYIQRHAPMLRIAIPYGLLAAHQLRVLAHIARTWDRGTGHFSTRQNIQFNWVKLEEVPDILAALASVEMHAIQTSGNCVRNITTDPFAGVAPDETVDPRPYCELLRQWSTFHPEFAFLPRKFKIAFSGTAADRAAVPVHDLGFYLRRDDRGEVVADVLAGGGLGRTPILGVIVRRGLPWRHLTTYTEALLRVYNRHGRRDNAYKARIKILVRALGAEEFARQVDAEFAHLEDGPATATAAELARIAEGFAPPRTERKSPDALEAAAEALRALDAQHPGFARWRARNVRGHRVPGYASVTLSLKRNGKAPGDADAAEMDAIADLADAYSFGEVRVTHEQNLVLADVDQEDLFALWEALRARGLATPNIGVLTDIICCPGGDFCALANAKSIPIATAIRDRFDDLDYVHDLGDISLNISGCINSCGHHHVGNIGILGVDKHGEEFYQVTLGGKVGADPASTRIGAVLGRAFAASEIPGVVATVLDLYVALRNPDERFIDTLERVGVAPFKMAVYPSQETAEEVANV
ncbi:sulfite reductase [Burkholderiales bacterium GJ-E10]|nr:sulfite reductase [Burkholderiales bacterium GJ-E10]